MEMEKPNLINLSNQYGMTPQEFIKCLGRQGASFLSMSEESQKCAERLYNELEQEIGVRDKGKKLEELTELLFVSGNSKLLECIMNKRTSTNEIDLIVELSMQGKSAGYGELYKFLEQPIFVECKNYCKKVNVTYVGKFYSLMSMSKRKVGVLVTWEGVTGRSNWSDAKGLIRKIALRECMNIIVFDKEDLKALCYNEITVFELITKKIQELELDISYENEWFHDLEEEFETYIK